MDQKTWNSVLLNFPEPHFMQSWEWGEIKREYGWEPDYKVWHAATGDNGKQVAAALILKKAIRLGIFSTNILYIPKGPLVRDWGDDQLRMRVLDDLEKIAKDHKSIFVKIDPDALAGTGVPGTADEQESELGEKVLEEITQRGWGYSDSQIQFKNTVILNLERSEDEILAKMKQKTRYNIRLSSRKGVMLRIGTRDDLEMLFDMYQKTAARDGFVIREKDYYMKVWSTFLSTTSDIPKDRPTAFPLIAEVDDEPIAAIIVFVFDKKSWYVYGMSTTEHRNKMPTYFLQWEAIKLAKKSGCTEYDMWGAPDQFLESDRMWGVYRFKQGFGGSVQRTIGAWDLPVSKTKYWIYSTLIPQFLALLRKRQLNRTE